MKLLLFGHSKCIPCHQLKIDLDRKGIKYEYVDVEKEEKLGEKYLISSVPTLVIEDKGIIKDMYIGNGPKVFEFLKKYGLYKEVK